MEPQQQCILCLEQEDSSSNPILLLPNENMQTEFTQCECQFWIHPACFDTVYLTHRKCPICHEIYNLPIYDGNDNLETRTQYDYQEFHTNENPHEIILETIEDPVRQLRYKHICLYYSLHSQERGLNYDILPSHLNQTTNERSEYTMYMFVVLCERLSPSRIWCRRSITHTELNRWTTVPTTVFVNMNLCRHFQIEHYHYQNRQYIGKVSECMIYIVFISILFFLLIILFP